MTPFDLDALRRTFGVDDVGVGTKMSYHLPVTNASAASSVQTVQVTVPVSQPIKPAPAIPEKFSRWMHKTVAEVMQSANGMYDRAVRVTIPGTGGLYVYMPLSYVEAGMAIRFIGDDTNGFFITKDVRPVFQSYDKNNPSFAIPNGATPIQFDVYGEPKIVWSEVLQAVGGEVPAAAPSKKEKAEIIKPAYVEEHDEEYDEEHDEVDEPMPEPAPEMPILCCVYEEDGPLEKLLQEWYQGTHCDMVQFLRDAYKMFREALDEAFDYEDASDREAIIISHIANVPVPECYDMDSGCHVEGLNKDTVMLYFHSNDLERKDHRHTMKISTRHVILHSWVEQDTRIVQLGEPTYLEIPPDLLKDA